MSNLCADEIQSMPRQDLVDLWKKLLPERLPRRASLTFMRQVLAFETQAKAYGGLQDRFAKRLQKQASKKQSTRSKTEPRSGGRLLREWNGVTHVVDIGEDHYVWKGQKYKSLSAIARSITGAHWSGPRFFGLNGANKS